MGRKSKFLALLLGAFILQSYCINLPLAEVCVTTTIYGPSSSDCRTVVIKVGSINGRKYRSSRDILSC
ncbi:MAG: hypothetical protein MUC49_14920 [Raineya sp.]|jgi:hypothetical protein|nr:hypothetical protein [Raineya sp.]